MAARRYRLPVQVAVLTFEEEADGSASLPTTCMNSCADLRGGGRWQRVVTDYLYE